MMEVELAADSEPMIDNYNDDNSFHHHQNSHGDYSSLEGERCGICMDVVIDRGVLDCCQHWFCFTCIDNWATITNLCPLCQIEFQSITCVPVYDTIGSNDGDGELFSREDNWNIEGENNTLSFPSYYIDENAVICLDGNGCKVRDGSVTIENDPNLDTSIACDSCDIWYHAFCVGFDTEGTCGTSWLCPRCITNENSEVSRVSHRGHTLSANGECVVEDTLSGKVSISIADAGETAVVVSMVERNEGMQGPCQTQSIERNQATEGLSEKLMPTLGVDKDIKIEMQNSSSKIDFPKLERPSLENNRIPKLTSHAEAPSLPCMSSEQSELKIISADIKLEPRGFDHFANPTRNLFGETCSTRESCQRNVDHHHDLSESFSLDAKENAAGDMGKESTSEFLLPGVVHLVSAGNVTPDRKDNTRVVCGTKRKLRDHGYDMHESKVLTKASMKKLKVDRCIPVIDSKDTATGYTTSGSQKSNSKGEKVVPDIMSIVKGTDRGQREKAAGLRVKKIMRRATEDKESSMLVQKLRKEIREAVRNKSELGEDHVNPELLAAFRAAVSDSVSEPVKNSPSLVLKAKKVILQKGKARESLTKKIYGIGGKRKKSWTRDCEIEFWKHRCLQAGKPEKIDTLKSVLSLLRKGSDGKETEKGAERQAETSILSRLYLADNSVFPRKDDIKPISDLGANSVPENIRPLTVENMPTPSLGNRTLKPQQTGKVSNHGVKSMNVKDETVSKSDDVKKDKRKWALELLARKTAATGSNATNGKQENDPVLKRNYPLLAQLPVEMRPVLAPSRRNKIPFSVRQAQLYRLTEHFLRKANLPVIRRTADTELAVADAVNIEKEVADKSNSKLVYMNLMSQEVSHRVENTNSNSIPDLDPSPLSMPNERAEEIDEDYSNDPSVEEALKKVGLLFDSPPNSPCHQMIENHEANEPLKEGGGEEPDNVLEMGSRPELDIYGDFEYNLEDEDFIGASAIKVSKSQEDDSKPEQEDSKIKVVFSAFTSDKLNNVVNPEGEDGTTEVKAEGCSHQDLVTNEGEVDLSLAECEELYGPDKEPLVKKLPESEKLGFLGSNETVKESNFENKIRPEDVLPPSPVCSQTSENIPKEDKLSDTCTKNKSDSSNSVSKKVEAYIKEHIRPLCKSGVITVGQYRWAVEKTTEKVMKYHSKEKNAKFLIKEGDKVKKLAEQYVEASQHKKKK